MDYSEAMERYGTDKPDLRFELPMEELTPLFRSTEFGVFKKVAGDGGAIKGIALKGKSLSRKDLDTAVDTAKTLGAGGLIWMRKDEGKLVSPIVKYLKEDETASLDAAFGLAKATWSSSWPMRAPGYTISWGGSASISERGTTS